MATMTSNCFSLARTALPAILLSVTVAALAACGSTAQQRIGFIPESVKLNEVDKLTRSWRSPTLTPANYTEIVVLPTTTPAFVHTYDAATLPETTAPMPTVAPVRTSVGLGAT